MDSIDPLQDARNRIRNAYCPETLKDSTRQLAELFGKHFSRIEAAEGNVLPWHDPADAVEDATQVLGSPPVDPNLTSDVSNRFGEIVCEMLQRGLNLHHPRYMGHQVPAPIPLAGLFDAVGSVTNQCMAIYEMGPWATAAERAMVEQLGTRIGWAPGEFAGLATHGGSLANLTGLLTARNVALNDCWSSGLTTQTEPPVLVAHSDAHYSVTRAAGVLGIGTDQVLRAKLDGRRRMDAEHLHETLSRLRSQNTPIIAVAACACATPIGAFDPLEDIADVCARHNVWMHVDAAHGGSACLSRRHRHLVQGLELSDSVVWDAHKMLFVPALCAFVFYRVAAHRFEAFRQNAPYLFDPSAPGLAEYDSGMKTVECTKRAAAFGLWGAWTLFGPGLFEDLVDVTFELGRTFYDKLEAASDFEPVHDPECNIVVFRHIPDALRNASPEELGAFQMDLRRSLVESGEFYIVSTRIDGIGALRVTLINPLTTPDHLDELLDALRQHATRLL